LTSSRDSRIINAFEAGVVAPLVPAVIVIVCDVRVKRQVILFNEGRRAMAKKAKGASKKTAKKTTTKKKSSSKSKGKRKK